MRDVPIPYEELSDEFKAMVDVYVKHKLKEATRDPNARIIAAKIKREAREEICTRDRLTELANAKDKGLPPFPPNPSDIVQAIVEMSKAKEASEGGKEGRFLPDMNKLKEIIGTRQKGGQQEAAILSRAKKRDIEK